MIVIRYGLLAIFVGAGVEGEPFALAGGVLAHRHLLALWPATLAAILGSCAVDQGWFYLARRARGNRWVQAVAHRPACTRALDILARHPRPFVLLFRFAYGLRAVAPVAIGLSHTPARLFVPLNLVAAILWGGLFTGLGYLAGPMFERLSQQYGAGVGVVAILLSVGAVVLVLRKGKQEVRDGSGPR